jgi:hypothetical protein
LFFGLNEARKAQLRKSAENHFFKEKGYCFMYVGTVTGAVRHSVAGQVVGDADGGVDEPLAALELGVVGAVLRVLGASALATVAQHRKTPCRRSKSKKF